MRMLGFMADVMCTVSHKQDNCAGAAMAISRDMSSMSAASSEGRGGAALVFTYLSICKWVVCVGRCKFRLAVVT